MWDVLGVRVVLDELVENLTRLRDALDAVLGTIRARKGERVGANEDAVQANYESVDYGLVALLVNACLKVEIKPLFVLVSAAGTSKYARSPYARAHWKAEQVLKPPGSVAILISSTSLVRLLQVPFRSVTVSTLKVRTL